MPERVRRKAEKVAAEPAKLMTFRQAAQGHWNVKHREWKNPKHAAQVLSTLEEYAYPYIADMAAADIDTDDILKILRAQIENTRTKQTGEFWHVKTETASRVRMRIEAVLDYAASVEKRAILNPARWKKHLQIHLSAPTAIKTVRAQPALPYARVAEFMDAVSQREGSAAAALRFAILTAARTGMVIDAKWSEINRENKIWIVPGERMKGRKGKAQDFRIPLSDAAIAILDALPREKDNPFVFVGDQRGKGISNMAMTKVIERMQPKDGELNWIDDKGEAIVPHGFRSCFRDWCYDMTDFPREIVELCLAHVIGNKAELAYKRSDALDRRRVIMDAWAGYCTGDGAASPADTVGGREALA